MAACIDPVIRGFWDWVVMPGWKVCVFGIWAATPVAFHKHGWNWMICWEKGSTASAAMVMIAPRFASHLWLTLSVPVFQEYQKNIYLEGKLTWNSVEALGSRVREGIPMRPY